MVYIQIGPIEVPYDETSFDLLAWWKECESRLHLLFAMIRDLLTVSMSTVASEQAFSAGGQLINNKRIYYWKKRVETYMCLRDWFQAKSIMKNLMDEDEIKEDFLALQIS